MNRYASQKSQYRSELEAYEGEGPANANQLWYIALMEAQSTADWIEDMPMTHSAIQTAKGDVLKALVALEMAEERVND